MTALALGALCLVGAVAAGGREAAAAEDPQAVLGTLLAGLQAHFSKISRLSGRLLVVTHYSDEAGRRQQRSPIVAETQARDPQKPVRFSRLGAVYCEFWIDGSRWEARAARLVNSGHPEFDLPGLAAGEQPDGVDPPFPWMPHQRYEKCDQDFCFLYEPTLHQASMRAVREGDLWLGLRGQVYRALLEAAPPAYGDLIAREADDRARAIVEPIRSASTEPIRLFRVWYRTGGEMGCRATYWIQCWGTDFALAKYDDYWLRHDRVGYRRIGEVQEVIELANGVHLPSRTVTWRLKYLPDEERAWHSTTVVILLDAAIHDGTKPQTGVWEWLPLGTYISDPTHRAPSHHNPHYLAGNVEELRRLVFSRFAVAPPFEPRMDAPPDQTAIHLHAGPPELDVELPSVRGEPYDWGPSAKGATR